MKLIPQNRTGLFAEHHGIAPVVYAARATIPVREKLFAAGASVVGLEDGSFRIHLGYEMPSGIVAVHLNEYPQLGLRLGIEPPFPMEHPDYWSQVDFTPCPKCGAPVIWYEANFVPGYRVCTSPPHHHSLAK